MLRFIGRSGLWLLVIGLLLSLDSVADRLRAPDFVPCDRNFLTSWQGVVFDYHRDEHQLAFGIDTQDGTRESLAIDYQLDQMRLNGGLFTAPDWQRLELTPGVIRQGTRVRVWRCEQLGKVSFMIDWLR